MYTCSYGIINKESSFEAIGPHFRYAGLYFDYYFCVCKINFNIKNSILLIPLKYTVQGV